MVYLLCHYVNSVLVYFDEENYHDACIIQQR